MIRGFICSGLQDLPTSLRRAAGAVAIRGNSWYRVVRRSSTRGGKKLENKFGLGVSVGEKDINIWHMPGKLSRWPTFKLLGDYIFNRKDITLRFYFTVFWLSKIQGSLNRTYQNNAADIMRSWRTTRIPMLRLSSIFSTWVSLCLKAFVGWIFLDLMLLSYACQWGHAAKNCGGQLNSPLRTLMLGKYYCDSSGALQFGLPPSAYVRKEAMSDTLNAILFNPGRVCYQEVWCGGCGSQDVGRWCS